MERRKKERILHCYKAKENGSRPLRNKTSWTASSIRSHLTASAQEGHRTFPGAAAGPGRPQEGSGCGRSSHSTGLPAALCAVPGALPGPSAQLLMPDVTPVRFHRAPAVLRTTTTKSRCPLSRRFQAEQLPRSVQDVARRQPGSQPIFSSAREKPEKPLPPLRTHRGSAACPQRASQARAALCSWGPKRPAACCAPEPHRAPRPEHSPTAP